MDSIVKRICDLLAPLSIEQGDTLFVHAGIGPIAGFLGEDGTVSVQDTLTAFHAALGDLVGNKGTIAAPGFFYDYARKHKPFILETSPPDRGLGFYPMHLFRRADCKRSLNPIGSILAVGAEAEHICAHTSAYAFGLTTPWARMHDLGGKSLVIGLPFMMTFIHHIEAMVCPPHIYNKKFNTPVIVGGKQIELPVVGAVRYLKYGISYNDDRFETLLRSSGSMTEHSEGGVEMSITPYKDAQRISVEQLAKDSSFTLTARPNFIAGEIPDEGPKGPGD